MNVKEIFSKEIVETESKTAKNLSGVEIKSYLYNVEFGKTYYFRHDKSNNQTCIMGVKFHGITIQKLSWDGSAKLVLIGERADGKTMLLGNYRHDSHTYYLTERNQIGEIEKSIYLYLDKDCENPLSDKDEDIVVANVQQLINYLYPNKVLFRYDKMFRFWWDGTKVITKDFWKNFTTPMYVFFTKPKNSLWIARKSICQIKYSKTEPSNIEIGKVMLMEDGADEKLKEFFDTTYYDVDTCKLDNKVEICDFDEDEEDEQEELVYIEFIGLVKKETAKEILKQLKGIKI